jgi:protease IV
MSPLKSLPLILFGSAILAAAAPESKKKNAPATPVLVDLNLKGAISEAPTPLSLDGQPVTDNLKSIIDTIAKARDDKDVKGLVLRIRGLSTGSGKRHELRETIKGFRTSGKKVVAVLEMANNGDYLVAVAADEIVMPAAGWLLLKGLSAEVMFYKGLFEKVGILAETVQVGDFKGAGEPYSRTSMSAQFREELTSVLQDHYDAMAESIAARQGIRLEDAKALIDGGPYTPAEAKKVGLINRVAYPDQIEAEFAKELGLSAFKLETKYGKKAHDAADLSGIAGMMKMMSMLSGEASRKPESKDPKIAVIYASGTIQTGRSSGASMLGDEVLGSDSVIKNLKQAEKDKTVKAIVLRVDSPGGSALASDLMWREITRIEKPIVASMSDVAASGGYYISMGADKVYAEPGTLTGSIGVISIKFAAGKAIEKLGLSTDTITVGKNGNFESMFVPWTDSERAAMRRFSDDIYKQFVSKAAAGRKMTFAQLEKKAGGRIYTGRQAKKEGLVDELGTLEDAIGAAKLLAGMNKSDKVELLILPKPQGLLESLISPLGDLDRDASAALGLKNPLPEALQGVVARMNQLTQLFLAEPAALVMPFELRIH